MSVEMQSWSSEDFYRACATGQRRRVGSLVTRQTGASELQDALHIACQAGCLTTVEYLVGLGARYHPGDMSWDFACRGGHLGVVQYLLQSEVVPRSELLSGLRAASREGRRLVVRYLVEQGADPADPTSLLEACQGGRVSVVRYLIDQGAEYQTGGLWEIACGRRDWRMILYLAGLGVDCQHIGEALLTACEEADLELIRYLGQLLRDGCDQLVPEDGEMRIDLAFLEDAVGEAVTNNRREVLQLLMQMGAADHPEWLTNCLAEECGAGRLEIVQSLVEMGADWQTGSQRYLRWAIQGGHLEVVRYLVDLGADHDHPPDPALRYACSSGDLRIARYLIRLGVRPESVQLAYYAACGSGQQRMVEYCLRRGADHGADDDHGFCLACESEHSDIIRFLLSLGVGEESLVEYREDPVCGPLIAELVGSRRPKSARTAR